MPTVLVRSPRAELPPRTVDPRLLQAIDQPRLAVFWGVQAPTRTLLGALTALAVAGRRVRAFDGGNSFDGYFVARLARRWSDQPYAVLRRIRLSRAFTCFQLAELIENAAPDPAQAAAGPGAPAREEPSLLFVLDLLATFYDESVPLRDAERLLGTTITHLKRLAAAGPVIVGAREPQVLVKERWALLERLQAAADAAWMLRAPQDDGPLQPRLF